MNILNLSRRLKITILASTDAILALLSWVIIGPPLASFFNTGKLETLLYSISSNLMGFLAPMIMTIIFFHLNDMYRSISRFYEPSKHIFTNLAGGFIFGI